jgi:hypothetical protein
VTARWASEGLERVTVGDRNTVSDVGIEAGPEAPRLARQFSTKVLSDLGVSRDQQWAPLLVVSEMVTNAVEHGGSEMRLRLEPSSAGGVRISVTDNGPEDRLLLSLAAISGRGLDIVDTLSTRWGVDPAFGGKTVWCDMELDHRLA